MADRFLALVSPNALAFSNYFLLISLVLLCQALLATPIPFLVVFPWHCLFLSSPFPLRKTCPTLYWKILWGYGGYRFSLARYHKRDTGQTCFASKPLRFSPAACKMGVENLVSLQTSVIWKVSVINNWYQRSITNGTNSIAEKLEIYNQILCINNSLSRVFCNIL